MVFLYELAIFLLEFIGLSLALFLGFFPVLISIVCLFTREKPPLGHAKLLGLSSVCAPAGVLITMLAFHIVANAQLGAIQRTGPGGHIAAQASSLLTERNPEVLEHSIRASSWYSKDRFAPLVFSPVDVRDDCLLFGKDGMTAASLDTFELISTGFDLHIIGHAQIPDHRWLVEGNLAGTLDGCRGVRVLVDTEDLAMLTIIQRELPAIVASAHAADIEALNAKQRGLLHDQMEAASAGGRNPR